MLTVVMPAFARRREILANSEGENGGWELGESHQSEVLIDMAYNCVTNGLVIEDPTRHNGARDAGIFRGKKKTNSLDLTGVVKSHRDDVHVQHRHFSAHELQFLGREPWTHI